MNGHLIAACATAPGPGGVAILRLSGEGCYALADQVAKITQKPSHRKANTFFHAPVWDGETVYDDALFLLFRAPHSYTGEDVVEIQCHGGTYSAERILRLLYRLGAQPAEPGEFTKRAFLNGRLDLTQAEAVCDIIQARTERAAQTAHDQLDGRLSRKLSPLYETVLALSAQVEHLLDFDEGELPPRFEVDSGEKIQHLRQSAQALLNTWHEGRLLRNGALVVIAGKPNAGKSSLLNLMLGYNRAIVNATAGTTRDVIEERFDLDGIPIRLVDTAGLRETTCDIEHEGVDRAKAMISQADVILYLRDAHVAPDAEERTLIDTLPVERTLFFTNKCDEADIPNGISIRVRPDQAHDQICNGLRQVLHLATTAPVAQIVDERHYSELSIFATELADAATQFESGSMGYVPAAEHLRTASQSLGRILGRVYSADLLDRIFSNFCVGK